MYFMQGKMFPIFYCPVLVNPCILLLGNGRGHPVWTFIAVAHLCQMLPFYHFEEVWLFFSGLEICEICVSIINTIITD